MVIRWVGIGLFCCLFPGSAVGSAAKVEASGDALVDAALGEAETGGKIEEHQPVQGVTNNVRLRSIEERVNELKEKIFQSKAKLLQLQEVVLKGSISGTKAILIHKNEMGRAFRLNRAQYVLDGTTILNRLDMGEGDLDAQKEIEIFSGSIAPGTHQISVFLEYRGHGYGVFSYLNGYRFKIKSSYTFSAKEGRATTVEIIGYEKGGITTQLGDRPAIRYDIEMTGPPGFGDDGGDNE